MLNQPGTGRTGFTLIELLVSLLLLAVFSTAVMILLVQGQRSYGLQVERMQVQGTLRTGVAIITQELRGLGSGDSSGPDLLEMMPGAVTYRAMRGTYFVCRSPDTEDNELVVFRDPSYGLRRLEAARDSLLFFAENDPGQASDNAWRSAAVAYVRQGAFCPGMAEGFGVGIAGAALRGVAVGAPVRAFQVSQIRLYDDRSGQHWIGLREWRQSSGWSSTQPVVGPMASDGLRLSYLNVRGEPTNVPQEVIQVGMTLTGVGERRWIALAGSRGFVRDSLSTYVTLRNRSRKGGNR